MVDRFQFLRSSTPNTRPLVNTGAAGEIWTNFADLQFGLIDPTRTAVPLIAVRYFSPLTAYVSGDFVVQGGKLYAAKAAVPAGPFNASQWTLTSTAADVAAAYLPLTGGNLSGPLVLPGAPTNALQAATKGYVDTFLPLAGGVMTGPMTLSANAASALQPVALQQLGGYLPLTGGTLTGGLAGTTGAFSSTASCKGTFDVSGTTVAVVLHKNATGGDNQVIGYTGATPRWLMQMGDTATESGSNTGSNFAISRYNDAGTWLESPLSIWRTNGCVFLTNLSIGHGAASGVGQIGSQGLDFTPAMGMTIETSSGNVCMINNRLNTNGGIQSFRQQNTICGNISVANANATSFNSGSDARLKTNAKSFDAGAIIDATNVYSFEWKNNLGLTAYGVFAQEAIDVFAPAITYDEKEDWWGVDYSKYVPLLLQEIKDLRARVAALEGVKPT